MSVATRVSAPLDKIQGAGNDFVVMEDVGQSGAAWAPALCDRHRGVGADGLLLVGLAGPGELRMRMFNPDGTEDHCGNGMRCAALFARRHGFTASDSVTLLTLAGERRLHLIGEPVADIEQVWSADMGQAELHPAAAPVVSDGETALQLEIPVRDELVRGSALSTGTTHLVIFESPSQVRFDALSPVLETHPMFPDRTSVLWASVRDFETVDLRIWERGVGETLACGTGACAVAVASWLTGRTGPIVRVRSAGGVLEAAVDSDLHVRLTGPARWVFSGIWVDALGLTQSAMR